MAAVLLLDIMAQNNNSNASDDVKPTILHDFLGRGCAPATKLSAAGGSSPSASVSGGGGRAGGPVSTTSDLGSERQVVAHFEGVPFFGQKSDFSGSNIRYSGSKRSNSDSVFITPSREGIPQMRPDFPETSHLMKMLRNVGAEQPRRPPHEDETFMGVHQMRPTPGAKTDANLSKWDRAIPVNVGPVLQYPPRTGQVVPYAYQAVSNRFKDANVGSSLISQSAADEGSRTGIKGSLINNLEPGSSAPIQRQGSTSASHQMTIFYGGQAHVFDDVHPNKADVIMALAGSNGGSWSTSFSPNSAVKPSSGDAIPVSGENDTSMTSKAGLSSRLYVSGNSSHGFGANDRTLMIPGGGQGSILMKDARGPMQADAEKNTNTEEKE